MDGVKSSNMAVTVEVIFGGTDLAYDLHREATVLKENGNWDGAVANLERAKDYMLESDRHYTYSTWSRLAKFYQYAGRYEQSMKEFDFLIGDLERRSRKECSVNDPAVTYGKVSKLAMARRFKRQMTVLFERERRAVQAREARRIKKLASK